MYYSDHNYLQGSSSGKYIQVAQVTIAGYAQVMCKFNKSSDLRLLTGKDTFHFI